MHDLQTPQDTVATDHYLWLANLICDIDKKPAQILHQISSTGNAQHHPFIDGTKELQAAVWARLAD